MQGRAVRFLTAALCCLLLSAAPLPDGDARMNAGGVVYVDESAVGANDGSSWCDAYLFLQDGLAAARASGGAITEVRVAQGTYYPDRGANQNLGDRTATFQLIDGVALRGGYAGCDTPDPDVRDIAIHETILSGDLNGNDAPVGCAQDSPDCDSFGALCVDNVCIIRANNTENSYHVTSGSLTGATTVLDGFTITAGNANGASEFSFGGGMYNYFGSPRLVNCTFRGNSARSGGGVFNEQNSPKLTNCRFSGNSASAGGGLLNSSSSAAVTDCTFSDNSAPGQNGGGMFNNLGGPRVTNCTFSENLANLGGGMHNNLSSPAVANCKFSGNSAAVGGGGMYNNLRSPTVTNCAFSGNSANGNGGGMYIHSYDDTGNPTVTDCTFSENLANGSGGGVYNDNRSSLILTNSILWGNVDDADGDGGGPFMDELAQIGSLLLDDIPPPVVNHSIVQGGWSGAGGIGVLNADPLFVDADGADDVPGTLDDDLRLSPRSPAIDAGDNTAVPADVDDIDHDGDTGERLPLDLGGRPRFVDDPGTPDTGVGIRDIVDMGAFEFQPDCNRNGVSDELDIAYGTSVDCNRNGRPDECEIDNGSGAPGGPYFCQANCDPDCDGNGIPDVCQVPQSGRAMSTWVDGAGLWSRPPNRTWCLPEAPGNNANARFDVRIPRPQSVVTLNVSPTIDTLSIGSDATLVVSSASEADVRTFVVTDAVGITNRGTIRVTDRRRLVIDAERINQSEVGCDGGVLEAVDGEAAEGDADEKSILEISHARIERGTLRTVGEHSEIHLIGGAELVDVCVHGVVVPDGQVGRFSEDVVNDGLIRVAPDGLQQAYFAPGEVGGTLRGNGGMDDCVRLGGRSVARLGDLKAAFTNASDHRIDGGGIVFGGMVNKGIVRANMAGPDGALILSPPGEKISDGTFMASDGGLLRIVDDVSGTGAYVADGGTIQVGGSGDSVRVAGMRLRVGGEDTNAGSDAPAVLEVGASSRFEVAEDATIGPRGRLTGASSPGVSSGAIITVRGDVTVNSGLPGDDQPFASGTIDLHGDMVLDISKNLVLDGVGTEGGTCGSPGDVIAARGARTPPVVRLRDRARVRAYSAAVNGGVRVAAASAGANEGGIDLFGDFDNRSTRPECFDVRSGRIRLIGNQRQAFEVAGRDMGPRFRGFEVDGHTNFSIGRLEVQSGRQVMFADGFDNSPGATAGPAESEALYVQTLVLGSGSSVSIVSGKVYYAYLVGDASASCVQGCARLQRIQCEGPNQDGKCDRADFGPLAGCIATSGPSNAASAACAIQDVDFDGDVDLFDVAVFLVALSAP